MITKSNGHIILILLLALTLISCGGGSNNDCDDDCDSNDDCITDCDSCNNDDDDSDDSDDDGEVVETTDISGNVLNAHGEPLEGATVTISSDPVTVTTNANGYFSVHAALGDHEITVTKDSTTEYSNTFTAEEDVSYSFDYLVSTHSPQDISDRLFMKINGGGLFVLDEGDNRYYSRLGAFYLDDNRYLVNHEGYRLQGYAFSQITNMVTSVIDDIQIDPDLTELEISSEGIISYEDSSLTVNVSQIVLAKFISPSNLTTTDNIHCSDTTPSGQPIITSPGATGTGQIVSGSLENAYECNRGHFFFKKEISISGDGYFRLKDSDNNTTVYTLNFPAATDKEGYIVNQSGYRLTGYPANTLGEYSDDLSEINISSITCEPDDTHFITIHANLDSTESLTRAFDVTDPVTSSNFNHSLTVYDSLGNDHNLSIYYRKAQVIDYPSSASFNHFLTADPRADWTVGYGALGGTEWEWFAVLGSDDAISGTPTVAASGYLEFTASGLLYDETTTTSDFDFAGGAVQNQAINFDFGNSIEDDAGTGLDGTTQYASASAVSLTEQDGFPSGSFQGATIDASGKITGLYSNNQSKRIAKIPLVTFSNPNGLIIYNAYTWRETSESGSPSIGEAGTGNYGTVLFEDID